MVSFNHCSTRSIASASVRRPGLNARWRLWRPSLSTVSLGSVPSQYGGAAPPGSYLRIVHPLGAARSAMRDPLAPHWVSDRETAGALLPGPSPSELLDSDGRSGGVPMRWPGEPWAVVGVYEGLIERADLAVGEFRAPPEGLACTRLRRPLV